MVSTAGSGVPAAPEGGDALPPGAKAGPWLVERELGRGGMGAVYAVVHEEIGKRAALKVVHRRLMPGFNCDRMLLEAKVVNQVGHPNIVDIFETGTLADGRPYIVMERLCGQSLAVRADEGKLLPDFVIAILLQVCDALIAAHAAGIVHRDLK
ncbi:MAG TPA: protein kinase, partial [Kofleriaceae bacterium]|nr:protein kinase [Kofleriaceae bacterium]